MKFPIIFLYSLFTLACPYGVLAQSEIIHRYITETNQSYTNGVVTDGTYLYGTKLDGGDYGKGYIYSVRIDNSDFAILLSFDGINTGNGSGSSLVFHNDTLYGTTYMGGTYDHGTIFKIKTDGTGYKKLLDLDASNAASIDCPLIIADNHLYGVGRKIFRIKKDGSGFEALHTLDISLYPTSALTMKEDYLYGTLGASNNNGIIYKIKSDGTEFSILKDDFIGDIPCIAKGHLEVINSTIYGTTIQGGPSYKGYIYKIKTDGTSFEIITNFSDHEGINPVGIISYDSTLYGMTTNGGFSSGIIYKVDTLGNNFQVIHRFSKINGANPTGILTLNNNKFYGYAINGTYNYGVVFSIKSDGSEFTNIKNIESTNDGYHPIGALAITPSKGYGFTVGGGMYNSGVIYSVNPAERNYSVIHDFTEIEGSRPIGSLILMNDTLYGMANMGGNWGQGSAFIHTLENNEFKKLHDFDFSTGNFPSGSPCIVDSEIYGMTQAGGLNNAGTIFKMNKDGSGYSTIFEFDGTGARRPCGTLAYYNSVFYGLALNSESANVNDLIVFSINRDGTGFTILYESNGVDAGQNGESIITDGTTLYVISRLGGANDCGVLFKIKTDGTAFSKLLDFTWDIGIQPQDPLVLRDTMLYISTSSGGPGGFGGVLQISTSGNGINNIIDYSTLHSSSYKQETNYLIAERGIFRTGSQAASYGSTEGAISFNANDLFLVADQDAGVNTNGSIQKFEIIVPKMPQLITFNSLNEKFYGDLSFELAAFSNSGLEVTYTSSDPGVASINGKVVTIVGPGIATITASQPGNETYLAAEEETRELTVNQRQLYVTGTFNVSDKIFDGTKTAVVTEDNLSLSGIINDDDVDFIYSASFDQSGAGENIPVFLTDISLTGDDKNKYVLSLDNLPVSSGSISILNGHEVISENVLSVFPNPFYDWIQVSHPDQILSVTIFDITGQMVLEAMGTELKSIKTINLKEGAYFITLVTKNGAKKIFKIIRK